MKVVIECDESNELEVIIRCSKVDSQVKEIVKLLQNDDYLIGKLNNRNYQIKYNKIYYIESNEDHTYIYCKENIYETNIRIYELEDKLSNYSFIRISKSVILNLNKLTSVKAMLNGKYEALLANGEKVIISRHYVRAFKNNFGM